MKQRNNILSIIATIFMILIIGLAGTIWYLYVTGIEITQLSPQGSRQMMGYILETYSDKMIVVDGGTREDTENLKNYIHAHEDTVDYWFITHLHDDHIGAFLEIANDENITINNLVISINDIQWYRDNEPDRINEVEEFYSLLENLNTNIIHAYLHQDFYIDNVKVQILGVNNPEITNNAGNNSSMVIKFNIHKKSILFLGDTGIESGQKLLEASGNDLESYALQMAHHGQAGVEEEVYQKVNPTICFWPTPDWLWNNDAGLGEDSGTFQTKQTREWVSQLNVKANYIAKDGDITIRIW